MYRLRQTEAFARWLGALRDAKGKARILARLESARLGNLGDTRTLGGAVREMRVHVGPGYRVYFAQRHGTVLLLCGGDRSSQARDIERARLMLAELDKG
ncbi:MAG: type II toxin-antitoxin system RelE/ParE family toxin [Geminicoccaceae bacterium]